VTRRRIAAFRREHRLRFKAVLREFNLICRKLALLGAELVATGKPDAICHRDQTTGSRPWAGSAVVGPG